MVKICNSKLFNLLKRVGSEIHLPIDIYFQVHGDAAMIGQGVNQETLQLSQVPHFSNGGSVHFVVNNQVGFTTPSARGKTSRNCTDLAKQIGAPVIHCNGDEPEVGTILN